MTTPNPSAIGLFVNGISYSIPTGTDRVRTTGYDQAGVGGADYIADSAVNSTYVAANPRTAFLDANGRGFRLDPEQRLTIEMFGGRGDAVIGGGGTTLVSGTDNLAPWQTATRYALSGSDPSFQQGFPLHMGSGDYWFSDTIDTRYCFIWRGLATGSIDFVNGTRCWFPVNKHGIVINARNTSLDARISATTSAQGAVIDGIHFCNLTGGTGRGHHAIRMRAQASILNCSGVWHNGNGIDIVASAGSSDQAQEGNCNGWYLSNNAFYTTDGYSLRIYGRDCNAGTNVKFQSRSSGLGGVYEKGTIGNGHFGVQIDECGTAADSGYVSYGGKAWMLVDDTPGIGGSVQPGTNDSVWYLWDTWPGFPTLKTWSSSGTYTYSPAVGCKDFGTCSRFFNIYTESYIGDLSGTGCSAEGGSASWTRDSAGGTQNIGNSSNTGYGFRVQFPSDSANYTGNPYSSTFRGRLGGDWRNQHVLSFGRGVDSHVDYDIALRYSGRDLVLDWGNGGYRWATFNGNYTSRRFGTPFGITGGVTFPKLGIADIDDSNNARLINYGAAAPTYGSFARGHRIYALNPSAGGSEGWVCTTSGAIANPAWTWTAAESFYTYGNLQTKSGNTYVNVEAPARIANHAYAVGEIFSNSGVSYKVTTAGTTSATGYGPAGFETAFTDGTCVVASMVGVTTGSTGPSGTDPNNPVRDGDVYWLYQPPFVFKAFGSIAP